jgi:hypothetical protein
MPSLDAIRHTQQTALLDSKVSVQFGTRKWAQLPPDLATAATSETVTAHNAAWIDGGLTARVRRVNRGDDDIVAIKKARAKCLVENTDGKLSFVNEMLRRQELDQLAQRGRTINGITPTLFASLQDGLIVTPWIEGQHVHAWDERQLQHVFEIGAAFIGAGFFEWDFSPGNVIDDGRQVWLFDFGYMYRFDPLQQLNTAGKGIEYPQFHLAERIESRNFFGHLLQREHEDGINAVMPLCRLEKEIALATYQKLQSDLSQRGATALVTQHYETICVRWKNALQSDLESLYLTEAWRSHEADLDDDLRGQTCTPMTLRKAEWLVSRVENDYEQLRAVGALSPHDVQSGRAKLLDDLHRRHEQAQAFQVRH